MNRSQEQLKFVVDLAQKDLTDMRPGDLLNLRDDFQVFFWAKTGTDIRGPIGETITPFEHPLPHEFTLENFVALQKEAYAILSEIVAGRDTGMPSAPMREIKAKLTAFSFHGMKNRSILQAQGSTRDMFLLRLYLLLGQEPVDRILRCKATDCNRIFYRKRKQEFCSTRCTNRDYMKTYRTEQTSNPTLKAIASDENHSRYEKRVEKAKPGKAVSRRLRKKAPR